jgi:RNA polymerase-binding protein DksA
MSNIDVEKYRRLLFEERERLTADMNDLDSDISGDDTPGQYELADYDNHPADVGTETFIKERDLAVRDNFRDIIGRIDEALDKIERGTYGYCDRCGREISKGRLDAIPHAIYCVDCQDIIESR